MAEDADTPREINLDKKMKEMQLSILDKIGTGGINQNELIAIMNMMQKQEPNTFGEMMPLIMAMKMMNPPAKQDQGNSMFTWYMLDSMKKGNGGGELEKKIERLESMIREKEDKKMYEEVLKQIKEIQNNKEQVGIKDIITIMSEKDKVIEQIKGIANEKDKELLINQVQNTVGALQEEIRKLGSGGDINKVGETIKAIKSIYTDLGMEKIGQKSKEEILKDIIEAGVRPLAPAIEKYVDMVARQQQMSPYQSARLQQIQAQRTAQAPNAQPASAAPATEPGENISPETPQQPQAKGPSGEIVFPELVNISDGRRRRRD
jgi:hypothetical protein